MGRQILTKNCINCDSVFEKSIYCSLKEWNETRQFCSVKCFDTYRKGKPSPSPKTTFKKGHKLFSREDTRRKRTGPENNKWKGGITPIHEKIRKSIPYKNWRKHVFERDDYTCQSCGKRGGELHADHVLPFAFFPDLRFEILNGRTLCVPCHRQTPTYGRQSLLTDFNQLAV